MLRLVLVNAIPNLADVRNFVLYSQPESESRDQVPFMPQPSLRSLVIDVEPFSDSWYGLRRWFDNGPLIDPIDLRVVTLLFDLGQVVSLEINHAGSPFDENIGLSAVSPDLRRLKYTGYKASEYRNILEKIARFAGLTHLDLTSGPSLTPMLPNPHPPPPDLYAADCVFAEVEYHHCI
jgi:hypothetical protein